MMFFVSEIKRQAPDTMKTALQKLVYEMLENLSISFERVDTDEAITMEDCAAIEERLDMKMVKTLFLCNRQQTEFYLFVSCGNKPFCSKNFSKALGISRLSFAPAEKIQAMLGTKIGAVTVFSALLDSTQDVRIVFDKDVLNEKYYGCSDGTTTGYMKIKTDDILSKFLPYTKHKADIIEV